MIHYVGHLSTQFEDLKKVWLKQYHNDEITKNDNYNQKLLFPTIEEKNNQINYDETNKIIIRMFESLDLRNNDIIS